MRGVVCLFPFTFIRHSSSGNNFDHSTCCAIAHSIFHFARLPSISLDRTPASCISSGDWQRWGFAVPPQEIQYRGWNDALVYARQFQAYCSLACSSRHHIASSIRVPVPVIQLPLYAPPITNCAEAAIYLPALTHSQLQLLLCTAGHTCHFFRVMMPRDVRHNKDPRGQQLLRLFSEAMVLRLSRLNL